MSKRSLQEQLDAMTASRDRLARSYILIGNWRNEYAEELQWLYEYLRECDVEMPEEGECDRPVPRMDFRQIMNAEMALQPEDIPDALRDEVWATMYKPDPMAEDGDQ